MNNTISVCLSRKNGESIAPMPLYNSQIFQAVVMVTNSTELKHIFSIFI